MMENGLELLQGTTLKLHRCQNDFVPGVI